MNDAVHQLVQLIIQGLTWVLRTLEKLWVWSMAQITAAFSISWDNLPAWKVLVALIAIVTLIVFLVLLVMRGMHMLRHVAHAFWTIAMAAFSIVVFVVVAGLFSRGFVWVMESV